MSIYARWNASSDKTACEVGFAQETMTVDIDAPAGTQAAHPSPHDLLDAALASCTTLTLELYAKHKGYAVERLYVEVTHEKGPAGSYVMNRTVEVLGALTDEQHASLLRIANACPVHKTLVGQIDITTTIKPKA